MYTGPRIITNGLVLSLDAGNTKSYPGSGTTWYDKSGNGYNGILTNGPTFSSNNNGGIVFDGVDDYVSCTSLDTTSLTTEATLVAWLKCTSSNPLAAQTGLFGFSGFGLNTHYPWQDGLAYFGTFRAARINSITLSNINRTLPHMVTVTTKAGDLWKLYQNTTLVTSTAAESTVSIHTGYKNIGISYTASSPYFFSGNFYNFAIYNRALTSQEIQQNYNSTKTRYGL